MATSREAALDIEFGFPNYRKSSFLCLAERGCRIEDSFCVYVRSESCDNAAADSLSARSGGTSGRAAASHSLGSCLGNCKRHEHMNKWMPHYCSIMLNICKPLTGAEWAVNEYLVYLVAVRAECPV